MTALDRAFTLAEMDHVAVTVTKYLYLYMPRPLDCFLQIKRRITERGGSFCLCSLKCGTKVVAVADKSHALAAATCSSFQHDWITKLFSRLVRVFKSQ